MHRAGEFFQMVVGREHIPGWADGQRTRAQGRGRRLPEQRGGEHDVILEHHVPRPWLPVGQELGHGRGVGTAAAEPGTLVRCGLQLQGNMT